MSKQETPEIIGLIGKKLLFFQDTIQKTILHVQKNKILDIVDMSEVNSCINTLVELSKKLKEININELKAKDIDNTINTLQFINNELSTLFKTFGTELFEDLLWVCFGNNSVNTYAISDMDKCKFELLKKYFHPSSYRVLGLKNFKEKNEKNEEQTFNEKSKNLDCADISIKIKPFYLKVYGIQLVIHNPQHKKSIVITGVVDDIMLEIFSNKFLNLKTTAIKENAPQSLEFQGEAFERFISSLSLKDYLIYEPHEIYSKYAGCMTNLNLITQKTIAQIVKDFISSDLYVKRSTLIHLLVKVDKYDNQYLAYLLYDFLSNDTNGNIDTQEQIILFDSFPWTIKQYFKDAMKKTVQYTSDLSNFDSQKIPLEQQICLLKAPDSVKEKAIQKLKEVKAKAEDTGSKARQYLDGLLKIPFNIYKREPILNTMNEIKLQYSNLICSTSTDNNSNANKSYTSLEILKSLKQHKLTNKQNNNDYMKLIAEKINKLSTLELKECAIEINSIIPDKKNKLKLSSKNKAERIKDILGFVSNSQTNIISILKINTFNTINMNNTNNANNKYDAKIVKEIEEKYSGINIYMSGVKKTLDEAVHGHDNAKKQIERIVGQWINGKQDGYCFGFEGPAGVGKTTMAKKGLANCLKDENGVPRPFAMIQMGGDANGSSLHGHNYTYVGSTWGSIVQILIDKKCMNPIIFIDEIDKISKTEHGKEIVGILTHLLDPAQNDCFQDKYFSGIDLDLSKALFILSYNDVEAIDKILLDRIHRVKFKGLTLEEKLVVANTYLLTDVYDKMGLQGIIQINDEVLKFIIDEYTMESGVRKLKEILFEIVAEINLEILKNADDMHYDIPINITIEEIKNKYFKDKREMLVRKVSPISEIGFINGMYATALGTGGTLPIHAKYYPSDKFLDLKLTGLQQDVMRESMHVALTVAWNLTPLDKQISLRQKYDIENNKCGINIHTGDGATQKDGPSGGCAITCALFSLLNGVKIKPEFGITGEIQMSGEVTAIGGLNYKILGSIKSNVKSFIFPKENEKDFKEFLDKYKEADIIKGIRFYPISNVSEALELILDK